MAQTASSAVVKRRVRPRRVEPRVPPAVFAAAAAAGAKSAKHERLKAIVEADETDVKEYIRAASSAGEVAGAVWHASNETLQVLDEDENVVGIDGRMWVWKSFEVRFRLTRSVSLSNDGVADFVRLFVVLDTTDGASGAEPTVADVLGTIVPDTNSIAVIDRFQAENRKSRYHILYDRTVVMDSLENAVNGHGKFLQFRHIFDPPLEVVYRASLGFSSTYRVLVAAVTSLATTTNIAFTSKLQYVG